jgi:ribosomal protein S14
MKPQTNNNALFDKLASVYGQRTCSMCGRMKPTLPKGSKLRLCSDCFASIGRKQGQQHASHKG